MRFWAIVLFLAINVLVSSCLHTQKVSSRYTQVQVEPPLLAGASSALYKVNIEVFGNFFSGLLLVKPDKEAKGHHIVFLTEVGLTLCEYYTDGKTMELKSASSLFQNEMAQKVLAEDFSILLHELPNLKEKKPQVFKNNAGYKYTLNENSKITHVKKCRLINGIRVNLSEFDNDLPSLIVFKHTGIRFNMKLKLLKQN